MLRRQSGRRDGRHCAVNAAQACTPFVTRAQTVPAQHVPAASSQTSPGTVQRPPAAGAVAIQTAAPAGPTHEPSQQSSGAEQAAPASAHVSRQAGAPAAPGRHRPAQHCAPTAHGYPAGEQPSPAGKQRERPPSAEGAQRAPEQHSSSFMHSSPMTWQRSATSRGAFAQRPTPSGPALQVPEQHASPDEHRSCSGWHPEARAQRRGPPALAKAGHRPEQQSLSSMQSAAATRQPGSA